MSATGLAIIYLIICSTLIVESYVTSGNFEFNILSIFKAWIGPLKKSGSLNDICSAP